MKAGGKVPAIVSKRNHFHSADELVEDALPFLPDQFKHPNFRQWLLRYTETVIKSVAAHYGLAASRGIEQAAELLCDPDYYETRRQYRAKMRRDMKEQAAKQEWERLERKNCPTAEQIAEQVRWTENQIDYHHVAMGRYEQELARLRMLTPKNIRLVAPKKIQ